MTTNEVIAVYDRHGVTRANFQSKRPALIEGRRKATIELHRNGLRIQDIAEFERHYFDGPTHPSSVRYRLGKSKRYVR
jgi:hypothetical protein